MLDLDLAVSIKRLSVAFVPLMLGIILHEVAHGWAALKRGDPTAAMLGRLTLNPVPHIDPMGLFVFVLTSLTGPFVFGWAKPVPINPRNFRNIVKDTMLVSFAGPATNFLLATFFAILLRLLISLFPLGEWQGNTFWDFFFLMFQTGVIVNVGLGWLNLMPIPPLDGSKILWGVLPPKLGFQYMQLERYGFILLILLWTDRSVVPGVIAGLMVLPVVYTNTLAGIRETDARLLEMAAVFRVPPAKRVRYLYVPAALPYFRSACTVGLGLCWKSGVAAEVIGITSGSIGEALYNAKILFSTAELLAWTVVIVLLSLAFERLFLWGLARVESVLLERSGT